MLSVMKSSGSPIKPKEKAIQIQDLLENDEDHVGLDDLVEEFGDAGVPAHAAQRLELLAHTIVFDAVTAGDAF